MPEFTVKEVRLPELHLPEIKREEIVRSLSGVRLPEVDLASARRATIKVPAIGVSGSDVGKLLAAAAAVVRFARPAPSRRARLGRIVARRSPSPLARIVPPRRRRSRWPILVAVIGIIAVVAWAVARRRSAERSTAMEPLDAVAPTSPETETVDGAGVGVSDATGPTMVEETARPM